MKLKFSKLLSLLLAVVVLLTATVGIEAVAQDATAITISEINLTNVPTPVTGVEATRYTYTHTEEGVDIYTVTGNWLVYDSTDKVYTLMASTDTFAEDKSHNLHLTVTLNEGYVFDVNGCRFTVNGEVINHYAYGYDRNGVIELFYSNGTEPLYKRLRLTKAFSRRLRLARPLTTRKKLTLPYPRTVALP